jgi:hypothetical protein
MMGTKVDAAADDVGNDKAAASNGPRRGQVRRLSGGQSESGSLTVDRRPDHAEGNRRGSTFSSPEASSDAKLREKFHRETLETAELKKSARAAGDV